MTTAFANWLDAAPDDVLFICRGRRITRRETAGAVLQLKAELAALQLPHQAKAALITDSAWAFVCSLCACSLAGLSCQLPGHKKPELLHEQLPDLSLIITDSTDFARRCHELDPALKVLCISAEPDASAPASIPEDPADEAAPAAPALDPAYSFTLFTSGSTGLPKAVSKSATAMDKEAQLLFQIMLPGVERCVLACTVYPYHMYGLTFSIWLPLACRIPIHLPMQHYSEELCALPYQQILLISSPAFMQRLDVKLQPPQITAAVSAGGPLSMELRRSFRQWCGAHILDIYGSTETGVIGYRRRCPEGELSASTFLPEVSVSHDSEGRAVLHSPLVPDGLLTLDDKIELLPDGRFKLLGRRDRIVKIEEKRVALNEVERRLMDSKLLSECTVLTVKRQGRVLLAALCIPKDKSVLADQRQSALFCQQLRRHMVKTAEQSLVPRLFALSEAIPRNIMGKKDSAAVYALFEEKPAKPVKKNSEEEEE